jgi:hypothetical protein
MHHIMRDDPRRRFVHGLTIEDTSLRFIYHDRSDVAVSKGIDLTKASDNLLVYDQQCHSCC